MTTIDAPKAPSKAAAPEKPAPAPVTGGLRHQDGRTFQVVSFRLADEEYGVDIMTVQEIILYGCITQVPEVP
ncbi:MAG: chemotaxis protein CheW, partial [Planctomycetota bacterium]